MPHALEPVGDIVDRLAARADVGPLVHRREDPDIRAGRRNTLQLSGELAQQRIHLRRVAGALGLEFAGETPFRLGAGDDRVDLVGRAADDGLAGRGVDTHLEAGEVGEHRLEFVGGVFDQRHEPDVLAEQHRLALTHQVRARADHPGGVGEREPAGKVGGCGFAQRLANHRSGFGAMTLEHLTERDLDREDDDIAGFDAVVNGVVEDQLEDRVAPLVLDQRIDLVDPLGEDLVAQIQVLAHLAVLRTETGHRPDRAVGRRPVGAEHIGLLLAIGDRTQTLDGFFVVVGQHHRAGTAVVAS